MLRCTLVAANLQLNAANLHLWSSSCSDVQVVIMNPHQLEDVTSLWRQWAAVPTWQCVGCLRWAERLAYPGLALPLLRFLMPGWRRRVTSQDDVCVVTSLQVTSGHGQLGVLGQLTRGREAGRRGWRTLQSWKTCGEMSECQWRAWWRHHWGAWWRHQPWEHSASACILLQSWR